MKLAASDMLLQYSLHGAAPRSRGRAQFHGGVPCGVPGPQLLGRGRPESPRVITSWAGGSGGGTHTGPAFSDFLIGSLPAASGRKMRFTGTTVLRVENGKIAEEVGLDDGVTALQQLGLLKAA